MLLYFTNPTRKGGVCVLLQLLLLFPALGIMLLALKLSTPIVGHAHTALEVLEGYHTWYLVLIGAMLAAASIALLGNLFIIASLVRTRDFGTGNVYMALITLFLIGLCSVVMVVDENVVELVGAAKEDIAAVRGNDVTVITTYAHENTVPYKRAALPSPFADGQAQPLWVLRVRDPNGTWMTVYLPEEIGTDAVAPDGFISDRGSIESQSFQYLRIAYSPNLRVVTDITPVEKPLA